MSELYGDILPREIDRVIQFFGGLRSAARVTGIDPAYLSKLRSGSKSNPSIATLEKLGLRQVEPRYYRAMGKRSA